MGRAVRFRSPLLAEVPRGEEGMVLLNVEQLWACYEAKHKVLKKATLFYLCVRKGAITIIKGLSVIKRLKGK